MVEHYLDTVGVSSSNLLSRTIYKTPILNGLGVFLIPHAPHTPEKLLKVGTVIFEDAAQAFNEDSETIVRKVSVSIGSSLNQFHFPMETFRYSIIFVYLHMRMIDRYQSLKVSANFTKFWLFVKITHYEYKANYPERGSGSTVRCLGYYSPTTWNMRPC